MTYAWAPLNLDKLGFLRSVTSLFDPGTPVDVLWDDALGPFSRLRASGVVTMVGTAHGERVGVVYCDFRVNGGSFGKENSARIAKFVRLMEQAKTPIHFHLSTLGVRIMEGRTVFANAFGLLPAIARFAERNVLVTSVHGQCLGIGALIFAMGHYRLAVSGKALNLTGPEVFDMFFGKAVDFADVASVERQLEKTELVHEIVPNDEAVYARVRSLVEFMVPPEFASPPASTVTVTDGNAADAKIRALVATAGDHGHEVLHSMPGAVRAFLVRRDGQAMGIVANPPGQMNNMINVRTLHKYCAALDLFRALRVPVISFVDTPGADPRPDAGNEDIVGALLAMATRIIKYPFGLMGIIVGRCFGGASILAFPKSFGGNRVVATTGSRIGIMDPRIVSRLLTGAPRLLAEWEEACALQSPELTDMIEAGIVDAMVPSTELDGEIDAFAQSLKEMASSVRHIRVEPHRSSSHIPIAPPATRRG